MSTEASSAQPRLKAARVFPRPKPWGAPAPAASPRRSAPAAAAAAPWRRQRAAHSWRGECTCE